MDFFLTCDKRLTYTNTLSKRITGKTRWASTNWIVIWCMTLSIDTACMWTGISAFIVNACFFRWTFWRNNAFRTTLWWWANISWLTWAYSLIIVFTTIAIWTAWWWWTWEWIFTWWCCNRCFATLEKWISHITRWTRTSWYMLFYITNSICST